MMRQVSESLDDDTGDDADQDDADQEARHDPGLALVMAHAFAFHAGGGFA